MHRYLQRDILIWLDSLNISNKTIDRLKQYFQDIRELLYTDKSKISNIKDIDYRYLNKILENRNINYMESLFERLKENEIEVITILDEEYPENLDHIYQRPNVLYSRGKYLEEDRLSIGIVGARKSTSYGRWACEKFTKELVNMDVTIVSGLALGIDSVAHRTAIENGGRTIAVLGNGLDTIYPKSNEALYRDIPDHGIILTEFPLATPPLAYNFPQRNRIISGLSLGVIVIEAKEKSGSLITAHHALEQGKDIFALPGNINNIYSKGTNKLIKDGARPLLDIEDIIEEISEIGKKRSQNKSKEVDFSCLSDVEGKIVDIIKDGPLHCDLIAYRSGLDISSIISTLTILELKGVTKELNNRIFTLC